ncbi:MAG TPA: LPS assembly lipoprotein LptE [Burkholderiales bacterium]|nr:LPS assembly lipoprotein LptE [Burkholderiales bacterium]
MKPVRMSALRAALIVALCAALAACGFKLRGQQTFPFETISVPLNTPLGFELKRNIAAASEQTKLVDNVADADAVLSILSEAQEKVILSLNTQGRVREFQLRYRVVYRVSSPKGLDFIAPTSVLLTRDITFNDQVLAKETEEAQLYREMRSDLVQQIVRRLGAAKPLVQPDDE